MIVTAFLNIIFFILGLLLALLPTATVDSGIGSAVADAASALATFNAFIPLTVLFAVISSILAVEVLIVVYKIIMWALRRAPTQS